MKIVEPSKARAGDLVELAQVREYPTLHNLQAVNFRQFTGVRLQANCKPVREPKGTRIFEVGEASPCPVSLRRSSAFLKGTLMFALRHIASQRFMPQTQNNRGYTHWDPDSPDPKGGLEAAMPGSIRLFPSRKGADNARVTWAFGVATRKYHPGGSSWGPDEGGDDYLDYEDKGRSKDSLEIVPMVVEPALPGGLPRHVIAGYGKFDLSTGQLLSFSNTAGDYDGPGFLSAVEICTANAIAQFPFGDCHVAQRLLGHTLLQRRARAAVYDLVPRSSGVEMEEVVLRVPKELAAAIAAMGDDGVENVLRDCIALSSGYRDHAHLYAEMWRPGR